MTREEVFKLIDAERDFQDKKWGPQRGLDEHLWNTILTEELGEVAKAVLEYKFTSYNDDKNHLEELIKELVQVAAVATCWLEEYENARS